jgi:hypothetical protein
MEVGLGPLGLECQGGKKGGQEVKLTVYFHLVQRLKCLEEHRCSAIRLHEMALN